MKNLKPESRLGLSREDLISILGGGNVTNPSDCNESSSFDQLRQQQETLACDAIG